MSDWGGEGGGAPGRTATPLPPQPLWLPTTQPHRGLQGRDAAERRPVLSSRRSTAAQQRARPPPLQAKDATRALQPHAAYPSSQARRGEAPQQGSATPPPPARVQLCGQRPLPGRNSAPNAPLPWRALVPPAQKDAAIAPSIQKPHGKPPPMPERTTRAARECRHVKGPNATRKTPGARTQR
ncbi:hypothetical protein NDU88_005528 [Pleurodeles waltl]|uniref:Uncharacterized protein n=1 Tax=Pleurodeles waltl TaxID=8319 RepID=A0AAV7L118_PLEWA|nr:hypothetical protein NDU88_005528 [Pleurodeles waltl]